MQDLDIGGTQPYPGTITIPTPDGHVHPVRYDNERTDDQRSVLIGQKPPDEIVPPLKRRVLSDQTQQPDRIYGITNGIIEDQRKFI